MAISGISNRGIPRSICKGCAQVGATSDAQKAEITPLVDQEKALPY